MVVIITTETAVKMTGTTIGTTNKSVVQTRGTYPMTCTCTLTSCDPAPNPMGDTPWGEYKKGGEVSECACVCEGGWGEKRRRRVDKKKRMRKEDEKRGREVWKKRGDKRRV